jgi:hypothetical protein
LEELGCGNRVVWILWSCGICHHATLRMSRVWHSSGRNLLSSSSPILVRKDWDHTKSLRVISPKVFTFPEITDTGHMGTRHVYLGWCFICKTTSIRYLCRLFWSGRAMDVWVVPFSRSQTLSGIFGILTNAVLTFCRRSSPLSGCCQTWPPWISQDSQDYQM